MSATKISQKLKYRCLLSIAAVLALVAAFTAGALWRGGSHSEHRPHTQGTEQPAAPAAKPQIYYCSMHPQVRSPDPNDKCPTCFMDLIPVPDDDEEEDDGDVPRLRLTPRAAALLDIRTWPVERRPVSVEVPLFGKVDLDESRIRNVPARADAYVERLAASTPWQPVRRGETLADLYSPAVVTAMRELLAAADREKPEAGTTGDEILEAARARLLRFGVSAEQIAGVENDGASPRLFQVKSPADGAVLEVTAREGDWLREGQLLTRVVDLSRVWIHLEAYERDLPWLAAGQTAHISIAGLPGRTFEGTVAFADPVIDERSRTVRLRVEVDNPGGLLKPGMFASARVSGTYRGEVRPDAPALQRDLAASESLSTALVIPASAPLITGRRALVYVRMPGEDRPVFEPRRVTLGPRAGDVYVVEEGLNEGDLVVVHGQFKLDSELQIRGRPSMMSAPAEPGADVRPAVVQRLQTHCPVMGGPIHTDHFVDVEGYRIFVCCPGCDRKILEDPRAYLDKMAAEGVTPYRLQTHCPVMGGAINREFHHDHEGHRIYVCCPGCLDQVRANAARIIEEQRAQGVVFERVEP